MKNATVIRFDPGFRLKRHQRNHAPLDPIRDYLGINTNITGRLPPELEDLIDQGLEDGSVVKIEGGVFRSLSGIVIDAIHSRIMPEHEWLAAARYYEQSEDDGADMEADEPWKGTT
jgi:hypothetical protein